MKSIIRDDDTKCYVCEKGRSPYNRLEVHHIYFGTSLRESVSEKYGLKVYLCENCHRGTFGVHREEW